MTTAELEEWRRARAERKARFHAQHVASMEPERYCVGPFAIFIEGESSVQCKRCGWVDFHRGVHLRQ
jgi:hypothetical protein